MLKSMFCSSFYLINGCLIFGLSGISVGKLTSKLFLFDEAQ